MQIITIDDLEFTELLHAWREGKVMGSFWRSGKLQMICATSHFMLISNGDDPSKIALVPARSQADAENLALEFLTREENAGSQIELTTLRHDQ